MTLSQVVELLLTRGSAERSYVALTRNAKGDTQIDVKVQTSEHGDVQTVEEAETKALEVYSRLLARHPAGGTPDQTTVELSHNAKGDTQIAVQVRTGEDGDVQTWAQASAAATKLYDELRSKYPRGEKADGNGS